MLQPAAKKRRPPRRQAQSRQLHPKGVRTFLLPIFPDGKYADRGPKIAALTGGTLYEITPEIPYSKDDLDYNVKVSRANREQNDASARPKLRGTPEHFQDVKVIFLGIQFGGGLSRAASILSVKVSTYRKDHHSLLHKRFQWYRKSEENLASLIPGAKWKKGRRFEKTVSEEDLKKWIKELDLSLH